jgi:hypothetical protein
MRFMVGGHKEPMTRSIDFLNEAKALGRAGEGRGAGRCAGRVRDLPPLPVVAHEPAEPHRGLATRLHHDLPRRDLHLRRHARRLAPVSSRVTVPQGAVFNEDAFPTLGGRGGAA